MVLDGFSSSRYCLMLESLHSLKSFLPALPLSSCSSSTPLLLSPSSSLPLFSIHLPLSSSSSPTPLISSSTPLISSSTLLLLSSFPLLLLYLSYEVALILTHMNISQVYKDD